LHEETAYFIPATSSVISIPGDLNRFFQVIWKKIDCELQHYTFKKVLMIINNVGGKLIILTVQPQNFHQQTTKHSKLY